MKFLNIAVVPLLIGLGGLAVAWMRRRRNQASA
jgi:MYXO-CTERM domain-containing protein